ncbi:MAG: hypothetical protein KA807_12800 [Prolixibacteraceae bacterium]|nr:hypothetical protein [Prolixibacteraceae bacterium]
MTYLKNLAIIALLITEGNIYGLNYLNTFYSSSHFYESISSQTHFSFTKPIPSRIPVKGTVDLSFYVNQSVVFQFRYKLEVPGGAEGTISKSLLSWTDWINKDINEVLVPKLDKTGKYKMIIEYKTHISNEIKKYEKTFEVYSTAPANLAATATTPSKVTGIPANTPVIEKTVAPDNKAGDILPDEYQYKNERQNVPDNKRIIETEAPVREKPAEKARIYHDIIIKHSGEEIRSKVIEITPDHIRYIDYGSADNPTREIRISEVYMIKYHNGTSEMFSRQLENNKYQPARISDRTLPATTDPDALTNTYPEVLNKKAKKDMRLQGDYLSIAAGVGNSYGGVGLSLQYLTSGSIKFGIHGGVGYFPIGDENFFYSGGVKLYVWNYLYSDLQFGRFGVYRKTNFDPINGNVTDYSILYGPSLLFGYDWFFSDHVGLNVAAGASYDIDVYKKITYALDLGIIVRF